MASEHDFRIGLVERFLRNSAVERASVEANIRHPETQQRYPKRFAYLDLRAKVEGYFLHGHDPRMVALSGLRGVGKTTLMWQMVELMLDHQLCDEIYFINVNALVTLGSNIYEAITVLEDKFLHRPLRQEDKRIALFFDEVQDDPNWARSLKIIHDEGKRVFVMATGSSALLLQSTADLARRMETIHILPYKLTEWIAAATQRDNAAFDGNFLTPPNQLAEAMRSALMFSDSAQDCFNVINTLPISDYWHEVRQFYGEPEGILRVWVPYRTIPAFLNIQTSSKIFQLVIDMYQRLVAYDIPRQDTVLDPLQTFRLLQRLAFSDEVNIQTLSPAIGITQPTILETLEVLHKAEIIQLLPSYGGIDKKLNKARKAFFMSPTLRAALIHQIAGPKAVDDAYPKLLEDMVVLYLRQMVGSSGMLSFVGGTSKKVDFILDTPNLPILIEVSAGKTTVEQFAGFQRPLRYGLLLTGGIDKPELQGQVIRLPLHWFFML